MAQVVFHQSIENSRSSYEGSIIECFEKIPFYRMPYVVGYHDLLLYLKYLLKRNNLWQKQEIWINSYEHPTLGCNAFYRFFLYQAVNQGCEGLIPALGFGEEDHDLGSKTSYSIVGEHKIGIPSFSPVRAECIIYKLLFCNSKGWYNYEYDFSINELLVPANRKRTAHECMCSSGSLARIPFHEFFYYFEFT